MIHLIYGSVAVEAMSDTELMSILHKARNKNQRLDVTGMLLYRGGNFLQVLEGDEKVITDLFEVIRKDPRHTKVDLIGKRPIQKRAFDEWEMGFVNIDTLNKPVTVPGFSDYLTEPLSAERFKEPVFAYMFLQAFKEGMR